MPSNFTLQRRDAAILLEGTARRMRKNNMPFHPSIKPVVFWPILIELSQTSF
jgi:hypothetical protein